MTLRKGIFWLHLVAGVVAGVVVLVMSVTGVLLTYEKQIVAWADRGFRASPPSPDARRLPVEELVAKVREARPDAKPASLTLRADPSQPASFSMGREGVLYVDPYTGAVLGEGSAGVRQFFHEVTDWHRWLGAHGDRRPAARAVTGASNLAFLFLVVSGFYLWWPRTWSASAVRAVTLFQGGLAGKARDFNWHNVIGVWMAIPLFLVVLSATVISYPWASDLAYRVTGNEPPPRRPAGVGPPGGGPSAAGAGQRREGAEGRGEGRARKEEGVALAGLDALWTKAEAQAPGWNSITLRLPQSAGAPLVFSVEDRAGRPQMRSQVTADLKTGEVVKYEPYASQNSGRKLRTWLRFIHTGEALGLIGQTIAGIASAGGAVLVWTGLALAWRRLRAFVARRDRRVSGAEPAAALSGSGGEPA
jgi:uncharacterized iron-regulated membrane protein